ncbi:little elongation complex subunit 1 [Trichomycterus rosablanca]|uniref:little elongation complex subunit 1 n=1 Tax=Trichomycterus rosablanca TaxID=2290929 RepID=UPI002F35AD12
MTMMPGENQSGAGGMAASEATTGTCQNCTVLHQSLEEYVAALLKLKEKIIDTDRLLSEYKEKCDELQKSQRENSDLHKELDVVRLKLGPLEKQSADYEAIKTELEENKAALKVYQQKSEELDTLREENNKALAAREKLEDALKKAEDTTNTQNAENAKLRSEKKMLEDDLHKTQESFRSCQQAVEEMDNLKVQNAKTLIVKSNLENQLLALEDIKQKQIHEIQVLKSKNSSLEGSFWKTQEKLAKLEKELIKEKRSSSTQTEAEPQVDKAKVRMLLQELWHCVDPVSQTSEHLHLNGPTENQNLKVRLSRPSPGLQPVSPFRNCIAQRAVPTPTKESKSSPQKSKAGPSLLEKTSPSKDQRNRKPGRKKKLSQGSEELHQSDSCTDLSLNKDHHDDKLSDGASWRNTDLSDILDLFSPLPAALSPMHFSNEQLEDKDENEDNLPLSSLRKSLKSQQSASKSEKFKKQRSSEPPIVVPYADTSPKGQVNTVMLLVPPDSDSKVLHNAETESQEMEVEELGEMKEKLGALSCTVASTSLQNDNKKQCSITMESQPEDYGNQTSLSQSNLGSETPNAPGIGVTRQGLDPGPIDADLKHANTADKSLELISRVEANVAENCSASPLNHKEPELQPVSAPEEEVALRSCLVSEVMTKEEDLKTAEDQNNKSAQGQCTPSTKINGVSSVEPLKNKHSEESSDEEEFFGLKRKVRGICLRTENVANVSFNKSQESMDRNQGKKSENIDDVYLEPEMEKVDDGLQEGSMMGSMCSPLLPEDDATDSSQQKTQAKDEDESVKLPQNLSPSKKGVESLKLPQNFPPAKKGNESLKLPQNFPPAKKGNESLKVLQTSPPAIKDEEESLKIPQNVPPVKMDQEESLRVLQNSQLAKKDPDDLVNLPQSSLATRKDELLNLSQKSLPSKNGKNESVNSLPAKNYEGELVNPPQNSLPVKKDSHLKATLPNPDAHQVDDDLSGSHGHKIEDVIGGPAFQQKDLKGNSQNVGPSCSVVTPTSALDKDVNLPPVSRDALTTNLSQESIGKVRIEMGPPLPPAVLPLTATPPRFGKHHTPNRPIGQPSWSSTEGPFSLTQQSISSPSSGLQDQAKMSPSLNTPSPTCGVPSSPLQFGSATPKHAVPVPGRLPSSALNSTSPSTSQENSMQMLDTMYPELSAQARTLNILRGNLGRPGNESGPSPPSVNPISGNKTINSSSTAFTKTEQKQKRIGANVLLPKSAKRLRLDTCSPDPAAFNVTPPAQQDLSSNNQEQKRETDVKMNDKQSQLRDAFEKLERSCFDVLPVIKSHVFLGRISQIPALRDEEKDVISEFCSNQSSTEEFLSAILTKIKAERDVLKQEVLQSLCRVYIGLCRQRQDWQKAHALAYSVLKEDYPEAPKLILFMVSTWPSMLSHESALSRAVHTVSKLKAEGEILDYLSMYLHWKEKPPGDIHELISSTLKTLLEDTNVKFQKHDRYGDDLCTPAWEYIFSVDLLCTHVGWKWTHDNIVGKELWPVMNAWVTQPRNQQTPVRDICVAAVLRIIGRLGQLGIKEKLCKSVENVAKAINLFCKHGITEGVPWEVQLAAVYTTYDLAPCNPKDALEALASWRGETTQAVPSAVTSCITQIGSLCRQIKS